MAAGVKEGSFPKGGTLRGRKPSCGSYLWLPTSGCHNSMTGECRYKAAGLFAKAYATGRSSKAGGTPAVYADTEAADQEDSMEKNLLFFNNK